MTGGRQLKIGLRVADLERSTALYRSLGFREIPDRGQQWLRYLTFGHTWLVLSHRTEHGYHHEERGRAVLDGPPGLGFVLVVPTGDLDASYRLWQQHGLPVTLEPEDVGWARIFYAIDPDGYEVMFEEFRRNASG